MEKITGEERIRAFKYLLDASVAATYSVHPEIKVGANIVSRLNGKDIIIGRACNSNFEYAEEKAINYALEHYPNLLKGSTIYLMNLNHHDIIFAVKAPSSNLCSKLAIDKGISKWVFLNKGGFYSYDSEEFKDVNQEKISLELI